MLRKEFTLLTFVLPELNNSYDAILGMPYLENVDPDIVKHSIGDPTVQPFIPIHSRSMQHQLI